VQSRRPRKTQSADHAAVEEVKVRTEREPTAEAEAPAATEQNTDDGPNRESTERRRAPIARRAVPTPPPSPASLPPRKAASQPKSKAGPAELYRPSRRLVIDLEQCSQGTTKGIGKLQQVAARVMQAESAFSGDVAETIEIDEAETHSLTPAKKVRRVQLEDREICDAVLVSPHNLLLIGRQPGTTRLALWCGDESAPRLREIKVIGKREAPLGVSLTAVARRLTETIASTYPHSRVRVVPDGDGLTVIGRTRDDRTAREILRLVRNACLKKVNDRLQVR
jgi:Flp pilus assembly secretin CpaC